MIASDTLSPACRIDGRSPHEHAISAPNCCLQAGSAGGQPGSYALAIRPSAGLSKSARHSSQIVVWQLADFREEPCWLAVPRCRRCPPQHDPVIMRHFCFRVNSMRSTSSNEGVAPTMVRRYLGFLDHTPGEVAEAVLECPVSSQKLSRLGSVEE